MRRALRARQERMHQSAQELQRQVRRFRSNVEKISSPRLAPQAAEDARPRRVTG
jgi:hypothetical protein